jgi:serine/threonine-protein kinase RsbW
VSAGGDRIVLTMPADRDFYGVAHLVVGGLAARLDLTFEELEDLQVALDELLGSRLEDADVTVCVQVTPEAIETSVGPFGREALRRELERNGESVGLRRVLETVADRVDLDERDGGHWVELTKSRARGQEA